MKIEDVSPVEKKLVVSVPWQQVEGRMGEAFRELGKNVSLKGFRKGKVPRSVLEKMFGKRVRADVAGQLVRESFISAVTEHKLEAVAEPRVEQALEIETGKPFSFEAIVEVRGDVKVDNWKGMDLGRRPLKFEDKEVEDMLVTLRREHTELLPIEGRETLADTDLAAIALKGTVGEHAVDRPQVIVDLGEPEHDPLPGLREAMIGLPLTAADHALELTVPEDYREKELAGKTANLVITVLEARQKDVPALDDEFAKDTGRGDTLEELRASLRAEIEARHKAQIDDEVRQAALAELVKRNQIPVAHSLVERQIENKYQRLRRMLGMQAGLAGELDNDLRDKLRASALDEVRGQLLLEAVGDAESIEVPEAELDSRIAELAAAENQAPGRLRMDMDRDGRLDNLKFQLRQEKTLDLLVEHAEVTEREPEPEPEPAAADTPAEG